MISKSIKIYGYCCEDLNKIENYDKAINDKDEIWVCHHRLEIENGELINTATDLMKKGLYWYRPASELIFLPRHIHRGIHTGARCRGVHKSEKQKEKISNSLKGNVPWNKGKTGVQVAWNKNIHWSEEIKEKLSKNGIKGKHRVWNEDHTKYHYE